ncbi:unnamed protein product [Nippostrongylus brasiliensis]|uniref:Sequestosome-1 n=1 Tax=Nippostrongylus brasiliensis TaxID=27835 RepID=A0A0N4YDI2_NIPBR|nr:unnamed protein product [Nippostrongylus brasiliensis]
MALDPENAGNEELQTSAGEVRSVLGQLQKSRISPQSLPRPHEQQDEEEEKMDTSSQAGLVEQSMSSGSDWSTLRAKLEAAFGGIGEKATHGVRLGFITVDGNDAS